METYYLKNEDIFEFYGAVAQDFELYVPVRIKAPFKVNCSYGFDLATDDYCFKKFSQVNKEDIVFNEYRCIEPARAFLAHFKEEACQYFSENQSQEDKFKPLAICGLKNCDIFALGIEDFVYLGAKVDPLYEKRRKSTLIISSDCPSFKEACFCRAFDINPHVTEGFDFNLSPLNEGYLVDAGSDRAKQMAAGLQDILSNASVGQISGRKSKRESVIRRLEEHLSAHKIPRKETLKEIVLAGYNSNVWKDQMLTCVECAGCIFICDTCHCFLLADEPLEANSKRLRVWDGCLLKNFTRVAGGANPLRLRYMRLRNRYLKKFDFFPDNIGYQACCGCGRCIEVCPGKIDIRYILRKLYEEKHLPAG